jgi:hypothetical protein
MSVATRIRFSNALNCWKRAIRSGWERAEWMQIEGSCTPATSVELGRTGDRLDKDAHLVELEVVEQVVELAVLLLLLELEVVLLKTVQGQLGLVVDVDLEGLRVRLKLWVTYALHELLAGGTDLLGEGGREHHNLLVVGSGTEDLLNVTAHVCGVKGEYESWLDQSRRDREGRWVGSRSAGGFKVRRQAC